MTKESKKYKPFIATDREYLKKVAGAIKERAPLENIKFNLLNEAIFSLGLNNNPYKLLKPDDLQVEKIKPIVDKTFEAIKGGVSETAKEKLYALWDYLCEGDPLEKSDLIFVFGGESEIRPKEAARLYKEGWASKILFTGHKPSYLKEVEMSEAEKFAKIAMGEGVPGKDIILEKEAINTVENVTKSITLLKKMDWLPKKIILVQICGQTKRAYLTFKSVADWELKLIRRPVASKRYTRENYFLDKNAWAFVFFEYIKLYGARLMKHF